MLRKTLTILSLIGLLLSVGLWVVGYYDIWYGVPGKAILAFRNGGIMFNEHYYSATYPIPSAGNNEEARHTPGWGRGFWPIIERSTLWKPRITRYGPDEVTILVPLWIPTTLLTLLSAYLWGVPVARQRRRRHLGLCVNCGYSLHGLTGSRCPECGMPFDEKLLKRLP